MNIRKGVRSRQWIIEQSVKVFNEQGLDLTLSMLAKHLNVSLGRITHFFTTREALFIGINEAYQERLQQIKEEFQQTHRQYNLKVIEGLFSLIMDNQYIYRCAMLYTAATGNSKSEMAQHNHASYRRSKENIRVITENLVRSGDLKSAILEEPHYGIFEFQFVNLFTSWVISQEIYYSEHSYDEMKPMYLAGLMRLFDSYRVME